MRWLSDAQALWVPVTLVMTSGALYGVVDSATDSLASLTILRLVVVLMLALGLVAVRRNGTLLTSTLWAIMLVSAATALSETLILALPETDVITVERQASRISAVSDIIGYAVVVSLAVRVGARSAWQAGLVVFSYAAVFAPTWPFLSPGMDEFGYFTARWILMVIAVGVVTLVALGFRWFDEWPAQRRRRVIMALVALTVARIVVSASPGAIDTPLATFDAVFFGIAGFGVANGLAMGIAWLVIRARSPGAA